jgi:predicted SAM-dependent methyltransferase
MNARIRKAIIKLFKVLGLFPVIQKIAIYLFNKRPRLAKKYIYGQGIEIGACYLPLEVSRRNTSVLYIDRMDNVGLIKHYSELKPEQLIKVDLIDNGESLKKIKNSSQDFVIANHFIEHCEDPLIAFKNHLRVLRKGGIIFWAIPNKIYTFDQKRPPTTNEHLWLDHIKGPHISRKKHYEEYVQYVLNRSGESMRKKVKKLMDDDYSIHYHVWTPDSFKIFLNFAKKKLHLSFKILELSVNINEFIVVLKKY